MMCRLWLGGMIAALAACNPAEDTIRPDPGVLYTFPSDGQLDVPVGARIVVTFSDPVTASGLAPCSGTATDPVGALCLVGPDGPVPVTAEAIGDGTIVQLSGAALTEGTAYAVYARSELAPTAKNLPATGPLFRFTTTRTRPRSAAPALLAVNGAPPETPEAFRPMYESSTIRLVFSQPLDPRSVALAPGAIELVDASGVAVPANLVTDGIHVSIDPADDLVADAAYRLTLGGQLTDPDGRKLEPISIALVPRRSHAATPLPQIARTRTAGDPGPGASHVDATHNAIALASPLIGTQSIAMLPSALVIELGDPTVDGPLAFTIRRGQLLRAKGLDVQLGGVLPAGLSTDELLIELISDAGGRLYRNPHQPGDQRPENDRSPLIADLSMDVAVYAANAAGNAVLTQTVLGVQASGVAIADDGVLDIEAAIALDLDLLGVARTTTNLTLELITDPAATRSTDPAPPMLLASLPGASAAPTSLDTAIELVFSKPIDLERARAGGIQLATGSQVVASVLESHGAALSIRPSVPLTAGTTYRVTLTDVVDLAGNALQSAEPPPFTLPVVLATTAPMTVAAIRPGVPCALTAGDATTPGRCLSGTSTEDKYHPFSLAADRAIEVQFTQAPARASLTLGTSCNTGSVRIEQLDASGACTAAVAGTLRLRDRALSFTPDAPWRATTPYRLTLVSGTDATCSAGEICGINGVAPSFSPLARDAQNAVVRANLIIPFTAAAPSGTTLATLATLPVTDLNGSGAIETGEAASDDNRILLEITGTSGVLAKANFVESHCVSPVPEQQGCMALSATLPAELLPAAHDCPLPGGGVAAACVPVALSPQVVIATSLVIHATTADAPDSPIDVPTRALVMRLREAASGPAMGYIIDDHGTPTLIAALDTYLDAPEMRIPLLTHDLHAKPVSLTVRGPVRFLADGRIAIAASNIADVPVDVNIFGGGQPSAVHMKIPAGGLRLQLVSPPLRGGAR